MINNKLLLFNTFWYTLFSYILVFVFSKGEIGVRKLINFGGLSKPTKYVFIASKGDIIPETKEDAGDDVAELVLPIGMDLF